MHKRLSPHRSGPGGESPHVVNRPAQIHPLGEDPALLQSLTPRSLARSFAELEALRSRVQELEQKLSIHNELEATSSPKKLPPLQLTDQASPIVNIPAHLPPPSQLSLAAASATMAGAKSLSELPPFSQLGQPSDRVATAPEVLIRRRRSASSASATPSPSPSRPAMMSSVLSLTNAPDSCDSTTASSMSVCTNTSSVNPISSPSASPIKSENSPPRDHTKISLDPSGVATVAVSQRNRLYQILKRLNALITIPENDLMLLKKLVDAEIGDVIRFLVNNELEENPAIVSEKLDLLLRSGSPAKHRAFVDNSCSNTVTCGTAALPRLAPLHPVWGIQYPLRKLAHNLEQIRRPTGTNGPGDKLNVIVLVASGAYNPIHMLHVRAFYVARQYVESNYKFPVVGAFLSPSHDTFVRAKHRRNPREMIPKRHRLALAEAAVASSSWIEVDKWEITRRRVLDYLSTLTHIREMCDAHFSRSGFRFQLMYVCGCNTVVKISHTALKEENFGCIVVCRPTQRESVVKHLGKTLSRSTTIVEDTGVLPCDLERATSVRVRKSLLDLSTSGNGHHPPGASSGGTNGAVASLELMVGKPVLTYLLKHNIAEKMSGKEQWTDEDKNWRAEDLPYVEYIES